jgi:hypothetical protein
LGAKQRELALLAKRVGKGREGCMGAKRHGWVLEGWVVGAKRRELGVSKPGAERERGVRGRETTWPWC